MQNALVRRCGALTVAAVVLTCGAPVASAQFQPDLTITQINLFPQDPAVGETLVVEVHAVNAGTGTPAEDTQMHLWRNAPVPPTDCATADAVQFLEIAFPPETERIFTFEVVYETPGTFRLHAWVDCPDNIEESDETNNTLFRDVTVGLGDLSIESIEPAVADPVPNQPFILNVTVRNDGLFIDGLWQCGVVYDGGEPLTCAFDATEQRIGFPADSTFVLSFGPISYPAEGDYEVWAWVDCINNIAESDETNNLGSGIVTIGQADLVLDPIAVSDTTPDVNQQIDVDVTVRNVGSAPAGGFRVSIEPDSTSAPGGDGCDLTTFQYVTNGLEVGASATVSFQVTYTEPRAHRLWAWADSCADTVVEAREDNNQRSLDINVGNPTTGQPDLVVESITPRTVQTDGYGDVVTFDVVVTNVGTVTAPTFRVGDFEPAAFPGNFPSYVVIGSPGPGNGGSAAVATTWNDCAWRSREVASLTPGTSATVQFWHRYNLAGEGTFTATADVCGNAPNYNVVESSETNNTLTVTFPISGCTADADLDGWCDDEDFCPETADELNNDSDGDGVGDVCDDDDDNDGVEDPNDCAPRDGRVYPGATENCTDGIDNNCDGVVDEGAREWYRDADGDGFGVASDTAVDCSPPDGYVADAGDCDDTRAEVYPGGNGPCDDGLDNDCDGVADNEVTVWGRDRDGDGFTDPADEIVDGDGVCDGQPEGYALASDVPDPDDLDFMVPEPVVVDPPSIEISRARTGRIEPANIHLARNGTEAFSFTTTVVYAGDVADWLAVDPVSGTVEGGSEALALTPDTGALARATYDATVEVEIRGDGDAEALPTTLSVPVRLVVRDPILTVRHRGQGGGFVTVEYDPDPNDFVVDDVVERLFDTRDGTFEGQVTIPEGRSAFIRAYTEGDCSILQGIYNEQEQQINDPNWSYWDPNEPCFGCNVHPVWVRMDGDTTLTADYQLSGLACTACAPLALTLVAFAGLMSRRRT